MSQATQQFYCAIIEQGTVPEKQVTVYPDQPMGKPQTATNPNDPSITAELRNAPGTGETNVAQNVSGVNTKAFYRAVLVMYSRVVVPW